MGKSVWSFQSAQVKRLKRSNPTKGGDTHYPSFASYARVKILQKAHRMRRKLGSKVDGSGVLCFCSGVGVISDL